MKNLELLVNDFTCPEASDMIKKAISLTQEKDSIAKILKLLDICRVCNYFMEEILEDLNYEIELADDLIEHNMYLKAKEMMKQLTENSRHFYEFANVCTYTINEVSDSTDVEYARDRVLDYIEIFSRNGEQFNMITDGPLTKTYNNFKSIEADVKIDKYLAKKNETKKD